MYRFRVLISVWLLLIANAVMAHPHVFIEAQYRIDLNNTKVNVFEASWKFDAFTSFSLILELDTNSDGQLQSSEKRVLDEKLKSFEPFNYFLKVVADGQVVQPSNVSMVDAKIEQNQIVVTFGVVLLETISLDEQSLSLSFGDDQFYFALMPPDSGLLNLQGALAETCTPVEREAEEMAIDSWVDLSCD
ncbi:DUF1007 family protein [Marinomonas sp. 2405UD68-3]|uniref:DUF1007 family protein n=1 Tax=Marinomonas sp. 2405UD68-3 TaxID=3391835 RepID=UPI0039C8E502